MNLTEFIYFAGIANDLTVVLAISGVSNLMVFIAFVINASMHNDYHVRNVGDKDHREPWSKAFLIPVALILILASVFVPGKTTLYAMAASELLQTPKATQLESKAFQAIENFLDSFGKK